MLISLDGVVISTDMVTQDEARKYTADYYSTIMLPYFGEAEKKIIFPRFDEKTYIYTDALLCYPHDNNHGLDDLTWVDAFTGEVLKYSAILAD